MPGIEIHYFGHIQADIVGECYRSDHMAGGRSCSYDPEGGEKYSGECIAQAVDENLIVSNGGENQAATLTCSDSRIKAGALRRARFSATNRRYFSWRRSLS